MNNIILLFENSEYEHLQISSVCEVKGVLQYTITRADNVTKVNPISILLIL